MEYENIPYHFFFEFLFFSVKNRCISKQRFLILTLLQCQNRYQESDDFLPILLKVTATPIFDILQ